MVKRAVAAAGRRAGGCEGDNELVTDDSRAYGVADVIGRVLFRYWPRPVGRRLICRTCSRTLCCWQSRVTPASHRRVAR